MLSRFFLSLQEEFGKSLVEDFPTDFVVDLSPTVTGYAEHRLSICNVPVSDNFFNVVILLTEFVCLSLQLLLVPSEALV